MPSTKVELGFNSVARVRDLDDLARLLFPGNKNHQKVFLAIFIELKYAKNGLLGKLDFVCEDYGVSRRVFELVRAKMRRLGLIDHVSRFNKAHGYREGWVLSGRFSRSLGRLASICERLSSEKGPVRELKERGLFNYL